MIGQTLKILTGRYGYRLENITIEDVRIGVFLTAVKLSNGAYGLASTQINRRSRRRDTGPFTPLQIKGRSVHDLFHGSEPPRVGDSLRVAVLNALSSLVMTPDNYDILEDQDPVDLLDLSGSKAITIVGAFQSYIRKLKDTGNRLRVLEFNPEAFQPEDRSLYVPAVEAPKLLPRSDIVIITGSATVNHSIDQLLDLIPPESKVVVTGPTSSYVPDILFEKNVDYIGATRITDPALMLQMVAEAASGYYLFRYCAQKIVVQKGA